jgi:plasmid stabilization system protein ParE
MMRIKWSTTAKNDIDQLFEFICEQSLQNALLVKGRILHSLSLLPQVRLGNKIPGSHYFKYYIPKTSYFVIYELTDETTLTLVAFIHSSRDWMKSFDVQSEDDSVEGVKTAQDEMSKGLGISHIEAMERIKSTINEAKKKNVGRPTLPKTP